MAFATAGDLAARLKRVFDAEETLQVGLLLDDATAYLQSQLGWHISPPSEVVLVRRPQGSPWLDLGTSPMTVQTVTVDGAQVEVDLVDGALYRPCGWYGRVEVTCTIGYPSVPAELVTWTCIVAAQMLALAEELGTLSSAGVTSVAIDDYRKAWSAGQPDGLAIPERSLEQLSSRYGQTVYVTGSR